MNLLHDSGTGSKIEHPPQDPQENGYISGRPTRQQQSYGAIISIIIIVVIVVLGALYTGSKRLTQDSVIPTDSTQQ